MPNRKRQKRITGTPKMERFKPFGIPMRELESVDLLFEEYEALRLADYEDFTQEEAAKKMKISRPNFIRLYDKARKNSLKAFVKGKAIIIRGGTYVTNGYSYRCNNCHETMVTTNPAEQCRECDSDNITRLNPEVRNVIEQSSTD